MSPILALPHENHVTLYGSVKEACTAASEMLQVCARAVNAQQSAAADADENAQPQATVFSLVLKTVWAALQDYARQQNEARSPAYRVPPELLCAIFSHLPFADRIATSHVCHVWRDASLAFPAQLWSTIPPTSRLDTMAPLLDRTAALGLPVDLMGVHFEEGHRINTGCSLINRHMCHIRTVARFTIDDGLAGHWKYVKNALEAPAPMLRHFGLLNVTKTGSSLCPEKGMFSAYAPQFERLELWGWPELNLRFFVMFPTIRQICMSGPPMSHDDPVWEDLRSFPALTSLELRCGEAGTRRISREEEIQLPRTLTRLAIDVLFSTEELATLDLDLIATIPDVRLYSSYYHLEETSVRALLQHDLRRGDAEMEAICKEDSLDFRLRELNGRSRAVLNVSLSALADPSLWALTFGAATSLTLYIKTDNLREWGMRRVTTCANVADLTIVFAHWKEEHLAAPFATLGMQFPRLRTLKVCASPSLHVAIHLDALLMMMQCMRYTNQKLELLCLRGVAIHPSPEALCTVADVVQLDAEDNYGIPDIWRED